MKYNYGAALPWCDGCPKLISPWEALSPCPQKYKPKANGTTSGGWFEKQNILKSIMSDSIYVEIKYM